MAFESHYKDHIMFMLGNKLLKDKIVILRDLSQNAQAKKQSEVRFLVGSQKYQFSAACYVTDQGGPTS